MILQPIPYILTSLFFFFFFLTRDPFLKFFFSFFFLARRYVHCFCRHNAIAHSRLWYSVNLVVAFHIAITDLQCVSDSDVQQFSLSSFLNPSLGHPGCWRAFNSLQVCHLPSPRPFPWVQKIAQNGPSKRYFLGTSLVIPWLRLCISKAGGAGSPAQGT